MIGSHLITNDLFKKLQYCISQKGSNFSEYGYTKLNQFYVIINNKKTIYINYFEAFNSIYVQFNCRKQLSSYLSKLNAKKSPQQVNTYIEDEDYFEFLSPDEKSLMNDIELTLYNSQHFVKLTDEEKHHVEGQIYYSSLPKSSVIKVIDKVMAKFKLLYETDSDGLSAISKQSHLKNFERIINFLSNAKEKL